MAFSKNKFKTGLALLVVNFMLVSPLALAQTTPPRDSTYGLEETVSATNLPHGTVQPARVIAQIINIVLGFLGVLMVILVIYAGYLWMTAAGNEEKITKAKKLIGNAVIGLMIVLTSYAISSFIVSNLNKAARGTP